MTLLPVQQLPGLALVLFVLVPQQAVGFGVVPPVSASAATLLVWAVRRWWSPPADRDRRTGPEDHLLLVTRMAAVVTVVWGALLLVLAPPVDTGRSLAWLTSFALGAILPLSWG